MSLLFTALSSLLSVMQVPAQGGPVLTLAEALAIAEQNGFAIQIADSNIEKSRQRLAQARGQLGPQVAATGTYSRLLNDLSFNVGNGVSVAAPKNNATVGASIQMPLDITGSLSRLVRSGQAVVDASRENAVATRSDTRLNVKRSYFNVLRTEGLVRVAQQALTNAQERAAQGELLFENAQIARVDLERLRTLVAQSEADLIAAQNGLQIQRNLFNLILARPIETPVTLADATELPPVPSEADALVRTAQEQRPEVRALLFTQRALAAFRQAQEGGLLPSLGVGVNYQKQVEGQSFSGADETATAFVNLNVPIFDSGVTRARVREARQDEEQARINLEQLRLGISQEVRDALTTLQTSLARYETAQRQVALAEEVLRLAVLRQQEGEATYVEIVDAQTQLTQARNQLVSARYDYLTAYGELQRALGTEQVPTSPSATAHRKESNV